MFLGLETAELCVVVVFVLIYFCKISVMVSSLTKKCVGFIVYSADELEIFLLCLIFAENRALTKHLYRGFVILSCRNLFLVELCFLLQDTASAVVWWVVVFNSCPRSLNDCQCLSL